MRGQGRKESLSDSRDLDGSYDQLTGESVAQESQEGGQIPPPTLAPARPLTLSNSGPALTRTLPHFQAPSPLFWAEETRVQSFRSLGGGGRAGRQVGEAAGVGVCDTRLGECLKWEVLRA